MRFWSDSPVTKDIGGDNPACEGDQECSQFSQYSQGDLSDADLGKSASPGAVAEFARLPSGWAEQLGSLDATKPPRHWYPLHWLTELYGSPSSRRSPRLRWEMLVLDARNFARDWAITAHALKFEASEFLALPESIALAAPILLFGGGKAVGLDRQALTIRRPDGSLRSWRRIMVDGTPQWTRSGYWFEEAPTRGFRGWR